MEITLWNLQETVSLHTRKIKTIIRKVLKGEGVKKSGWINVCFVNDAQITKFNTKFHNTKSSTDVLAFNLSNKKDGNFLLADIIVSAQTALRQAHQLKTTPDFELSLYVVHGILHILGFNDHTNAQIKLMRKKEKQYVH
ncbi:MAG: rRNA maturation RNase YbeY [Candidatus Omnitrophica bacterium]|nr:rRNA maturation RNase YbeY [Candidatus Omnitrophota bacterium]